MNYLLFTPYSGNVDTVKSSAVRGETASPGYYAAELVDYGARFELTADRFAACHRYAFTGAGGCVRVNFTHAGFRRDIFGGRKNYAEEVNEYEVRHAGGGDWRGYLVLGGLKRYFCLKIGGGEGRYADGVLTVSYSGRSATTFIGFSDENEDEAVARAEASEAAGFDGVRSAAVSEWESVLGDVKVELANEADRRRFYSALYHSCIKPVEYRKGRYVEFATTWDTYRTQLPMVFTLCRRYGREIALSMLKTSEELGFFPNCYLHHNRLRHNDVQASALGAYVVADACFRGLLGKAEYPWIKEFFRREFSTTDISNRAASHALDLGGAYHAAAEAAALFGDSESAAEWSKASEVWRMAYDPETGYLRRAKSLYEGDERNYAFRVHVGMNDRIRLAGGVEKFELMLNDFFAVGQDLSGWTPAKDRYARRGRFEGLNNEADMNSPLSWYWIGRADRVVEVHDLIRRCRFADGEGALPGNNDGGALSSWYVWSCLGVYPVSGTPYSMLVSPLVDSADVPFAGGRLTIRVKRESPKSIYPVDFAFNGKVSRNPWIKTSTLVAGGELVFRLSDKPGAKTAVPGFLK